MSTPPALSTAAQKAGVGHDTPVGVAPSVVADGCPGSMRDGPDQATPFHCSAPPEPSTAVQNVVAGQETPANEEASPKESGMLHRSPFHWEIPPDVDMQNEAVAHEMADTDPQSPLVPAQALPLNAKAFPSASTAAQYPDGAHPTASRPLAPSSVVGGDQPLPFQLTVWLPAVATAMQKLGSEHETEMAPGPIGCRAAGTGPVQRVPSNW